MRVRSTLRPISFRTAIALASALAALFPSPAPAQQSFLQSVTPKYQLSPTGQSIDKAKLRTCFLSGECEHTPQTEVYQYPMPCEGSGSSECTGCWKRQGPGMIRVGNLDTTKPKNEQCPTGQTRIFLGYQMLCPGPSVTPGTSCTNGKIVLGCELAGDKIGNAAAASYFGECFNGNRIVVDATNMSSMCDAGLYRDTTTGDCTLCPAGTYKPKAGDKQSLCAACPAPKPILNGSGTQVGFAPLVTTGPGGATAPQACSYGTPTCTDTTYTVSGDTCIPKQCTLGMTYTTVPPDSTQGKKGSIVVSYTGAQGAVTTTISGAYNGSSTAPSPVTFGGTSVILDPGSYSIKVKDPICERTSDITLADTPSCGLVLQLVPKQPTKKGDGTSNLDGEIAVTITGNNGTPTTKLYDSMNVEVGMAQTGASANFTALKADTYTIRTTDSACTVTAKATLTQTSGSCALALATVGTTAESALNASDGTMTVSTTGAVGTIAYTINPISPNTHTGGTFPSKSSTGAMAATLKSGSYMIRATDDALSGCSATAYGTINTPPASSCTCPTGWVVSGSDCVQPAYNSSNPMLVGNIHSPADCVNAGGTVVYENITTLAYLSTSGSIPTDNGFCKFSFAEPSAANVCPSGWTKFRDYRTTRVDYYAQSYMQTAMNDPYADHACAPPKWDDITDKTITSEGVFYTSALMSETSGFQNGPVTSVSVATRSYWDTSCGGANSPNPPSPWPVPVVSTLSEKIWYAARDAVDRCTSTGFDWLFPNAHAKLACNTSTSCRQTVYNDTVNLQTIEIGCY